MSQRSNTSFDAAGRHPSPVLGWSVAGLMIPLILFQATWVERLGWATAGVQLVAVVILIAGVVARRRWASALLLGHAVFMVLLCAAGLWVWYTGPLVPALRLIGYLGVVALLLPARLGERTSTRWMLVALAFACQGAVLAVTHAALPQRYFPDLPLTLALPALAAVVAAIAGALARARWTAAATAVAAILLAVVAIATWSLPHGPGPRNANTHLCRALLTIAAAVTATAAAVLAQPAGGAFRRRTAIP